MPDETTTAAPTAEQTAAAHESANALVASSVPDMLVLIEGADLQTLKFALEAEQAKGAAARKGAVAALQSAIDGHPELSASAAAAADAPAVPLHDTKHDDGLAPLDARVPGDAAPLTAAAPAIVDSPKDPLGSLPDTAKTTSIVSGPLIIGADVADRFERDVLSGLTDAVIPTKPGGADEQDVLDDETKQVASKAPKREAVGLVNDLDLHWSEFKHKVSMVTGELDGEIGEAIDFARKFL